MYVQTAPFLLTDVLSHHWILILWTNTCCVRFIRTLKSPLQAAGVKGFYSVLSGRMHIQFLQAGYTSIHMEVPMLYLMPSSFWIFSRDLPLVSGITFQIKTKATAIITA